MSCGADTEGLGLLADIKATLNVSVPYVTVSGELFQVPAISGSEMYQVVQEPSNGDITSGAVDGTGTFDVLMASISAHLKDQFDRGRITGAEYTKAYIALTQSALSTATQFALTKQQAFWQAQQAQVATITGKLQLETARVEHAKAQYDAETAAANYALVTLKLANESQQFCVYKFQLETLLPAQAALLEEQTEVQRAQTLDTRTDTATVVGLIGRQKALYTQQITSYERDAQTKAAKLFTDAWITQKTIDEGLTAPDGFTNASVDEVLTAIKSANNLD